MSTIFRLADSLSRLLAICAGIGVLAMMLHVCGDILWRIFAGSSLPATVEIVSYYYMVLVAFLPLAWVERKRSMITVELLEFALSPALQRISDALVAIAGCCIYAVLAIATWQTALRNYDTGTFVIALQAKIVTWPGYFLPPVGFALAALILVVRLLQILRAPLDHHSTAEIEA